MIEHMIPSRTTEFSNIQSLAMLIEVKNTGQIAHTNKIYLAAMWMVAKQCANSRLKMAAFPFFSDKGLHEPAICGYCLLSTVIVY